MNTLSSSAYILTDHDCVLWIYPQCYSEAGVGEKDKLGKLSVLGVRWRVSLPRAEVFRKQSLKMRAFHDI